MSADIRLEIRETIGVLTLDRPEAKVNLLDRPFLTGLRDQLAALARHRELAGLVIVSGKPDHFCAGLDPALFEAIGSAAEARALARQGQEIFNQLADLEVPTVAAIHGACLGTGTELALACDYRLLSDDPRTFLSLPETTLGLLPGFGATQRLPRLVGIKAALHLLTSNARVYPNEALQLGLADEIVPGEHLLTAARRLLLAHPRPDRPGRAGLLDRLPPWRKLLFLQAGHAARRGGGQHYPAQPAAIHAVAAGCGREPAVGMESAARLLGEMAITDTARHLQQVFRLRERYSHPEEPEAHRFSRVAVAGAGMMGAAVVARLAEVGLQPRLLNRSLAGLKRALGGMRKNLAGRQGPGGLDPGAAGRIMARVSYDTGLRGLRGQEAVIEAVAENLGVKKSVLADIAREVPAEALILTTTSSLPVSELAGAVVHPGRVAGMHFGNPSGRPWLVEVISGEATTETTRRAVMALARQLGAIPVAVHDRPGFLLNRLLLSYLNEAVILLAGGTRIEMIERAMVDFGMEVGPFAQLDRIGLDRAAQVCETLHRAFGERLQPSPLLARMVEAGRLGCRSGQGFYLYDNSGRRRVARDLPKLLKLGPPARKPPGGEEIVDRLLLVMLNEAARCLTEGVVADPANLDTALLFGAGFPPYTGGLLRYADDRSAVNLVKRLRQLAEEVGSRYAPAQLLLTMAENGRKFYQP